MKLRLILLPLFSYSTVIRRCDRPPGKSCQIQAVASFDGREDVPPGAFLKGCWSKVLLQRVFLKQHFWTRMEVVKSGRMYVDEGEIVSCPWLHKRLLLSYRFLERIWTQVRSGHLNLCLHQCEAHWAGLLTTRKCVAWLYSTISLPQFSMVISLPASLKPLKLKAGTGGMKSFPLQEIRFVTTWGTRT